MIQFDPRSVNLAALDTATKYPSIPTFHAMDPSNGKLLERWSVTFSGPVILTEKVDGTNVRIIFTPDGRWFIGSRDRLLHAAGDIIHNPDLGIVDAVRPLVERLATAWAIPGTVSVVYGELYGGKIGRAAKQYTLDPDQFGFRVFDAARIDHWADLLQWPVDLLARWRDGGGQSFADEETLLARAAASGVELTPRLGRVDAAELPVSLAEAEKFLTTFITSSGVRLDEHAGGQPEGIVLRSPDRAWIAKARFVDYARAAARGRNNRVQA